MLVVDIDGGARRSIRRLFRQGYLQDTILTTGLDLKRGQPLNHDRSLSMKEQDIPYHCHGNTSQTERVKTREVIA